MQHITDRLLDRLEDCVDKFPTAVILGGAGEQMVGAGDIVQPLQQQTSSSACGALWVLVVVGCVQTG